MLRISEMSEARHRNDFNRKRPAVFLRWACDAFKIAIKAYSSFGCLQVSFSNPWTSEMIACLLSHRTGRPLPRPPVLVVHDHSSFRDTGLPHRPMFRIPARFL